MPMLGRLALLLAFGTAMYAVVVGNRLHPVRMRESVRGAAVASALSMTAAVLVLEYCILTGDYQVQAVYNHSDRALPFMYKIGVLWGGDSGSVLFWGWILSLYTAYIAFFGWKRETRMTPMVVPLLAAGTVFFSGMSNVVVDPFRLVAGHPTNGAGLDPLLENAVMTIHPPAMYTGLIGMSVPAAYVVSAIWGRVPWRTWVPVVRRWMLFSWMLLGVALILGGLWAYMELGWGGYWEWDPVENAALLPWLTATAFLHALQLEEKRGVFRLWTAGLGAATFLLTLVATYITRSGVLKNSVHSFTGTGVGPYFVAWFWIAAGFMAVVFWRRRDMFQDRLTVDGSFSKETVYLLIDISFSVLALVVLGGTFYPVISKAFLGQTIVLNASFFNAMTRPFFLLIMVLMGAAPVMGWRRARMDSVAVRLRIPWMAALAVALFTVLHGYRSPWAIGGMGIAAFATTSMLQEFGRAAWIQRQSRGGTVAAALLRAIGTNRRRFGGYLAHLAFLLVVFGVIGSHTNAMAATETVSPGERFVMDGFHLRYQGFTNTVHAGYVTTSARLRVRYGGHTWTADPGLSFFPGTAQPVANISIHPGWMHDLYVVLEGSPGGQTALLEVMINPMVSWIWVGMLVLAAGTMLAMSAPGGRDATWIRPSEVDGLWRPLAEPRVLTTEGRDRS
ncbi:heme lyase CcmF/NrfE family subunit [Sulfobacillus sp. DSM 109850]|uniref:Heme lyase CcmF/NrfE family subunit n=2 Tax=Sulfobacillus harzensis TaxID=2729629 RepID=A0A7Y0L5G3_9FIRM|nr:heme lyase CcmF/NrfE family subunit [Sulfobacillus harzensis]